MTKLEKKLGNWLIDHTWGLVVIPILVSLLTTLLMTILWFKL